MSASVTTLTALRRARLRRLSAARAPQPPARRPRGRAWINGREIGVPPAGTAHLGIAHD